MSLGAAAERDLLLHDLAEQMVRGLLNFLERNKEQVRRQIAFDGEVQFVYGGKTGETARKELSLPPEIHFTVILSEPVPGKEDAVAFVAARKSGIQDAGANEALVIPLLQEDARFMAAIDAGYVPFLLNLLSKNADVIVHEVVHILDHYRSGGELLSRQSTGDRSRADYVNHPLEFNAHFLGAMTELRNWWGNVTPATRRKVMSSYDSFVKRFAKTQQGRVLMESRRERWIRKRDVRLWQVYNVLKERVREDW